MGPHCPTSQLNFKLMKAKLLEIYWHEKQPIYALCSNPTYKFASAGADNAIRVVALPLICRFGPFQIPFRSFI